MQEKHSDTRQTTEFECPNCSFPAFETIRRERLRDIDGNEREFLVMRCLNCFQFFSHELVAKEACATAVEHV